MSVRATFAAVLAAVVGVVLVPAGPAAAVPSPAATSAERGHGSPSFGWPSLTPGTLRVGSMTDPLAVDTATPTLSWRLSSARRGAEQRAYQVRVRRAGSGTVVWDTGKVVSADQSVGYAGAALASRDRLTWQVRAWDGNGLPSAWSRPGRFEIGLLSPSDWTAKWIADDSLAKSVTVPVAPRGARYVRLNVTRLGLPLKGASASRLQLSEMQVLKAGAVVSTGAAVSANDSELVGGQWDPRYATDGTLISDSAPRGFSSREHASPDLASPVWLEIDLGSVRDVDAIRLWPRTEVRAAGDLAAAFPENFTVELRNTTAEAFATGATVTGQKAPDLKPAPLPIFARDFTLGKRVARARLRAVGLGVFEARLNGRKVSDAVLEPVNTDYRDRINYSTYDVTAQLRRGRNTVGFLLGNGIYNVPGTPGRYQKFSGSMGTPKLLAQLDVTYLDGTTATIASDSGWKTVPGPITFSGWYGGEDFDANAVPAGWDAPGAGRSTWSAATEVAAPTATLHAQQAPPIRVQQELTAVKRTEVAANTWLFDLGRNHAGWPKITVRGAAGRTVKITPGEKLSNGRVTQSEIGGPMYYSYTAKGDRAQTWTPRFTYTGYRYFEVSGLPTAPALTDVKSQVLRADNTRAGSFTSSDASLNKVHDLVVRAVESNMMSIMTDCPHREKLGWLEETHLLYDTIAANFDVQAATHQWMDNLADSQLASGLVPSIAPESVQFDGAFRDDVNWGGAMVMIPFKAYQDYGDRSLLRENYPAMKLYMSYLASKVNAAGVLDYGLGDWGSIDNSTPRAVTATTAWYRYAVAMQQIAQVVGQSADATAYGQQAEKIKAAFNTRYYDAVNGRYGTSQGSNALPLAAGIVPAENRARVLAALKADIVARGTHLSTGEISLRGLLDALGDAGEANLVLDMALNPTQPSYQFMVDSGATTLWEYWDGTSSNNHFMMGAIDDWSYRNLAGIRSTAPGLRTFDVAPQIPDRLDTVAATWPTAYGSIASSWQRDKTARTFVLKVTVPVGTTATVKVPLLGAGSATASTGAASTGVSGGTANYRVGSGTYQFKVALP